MSDMNKSMRELNTLLGIASPESDEDVISPIAISAVKRKAEKLLKNYDALLATNARLRDLMITTCKPALCLANTPPPENLNTICSDAFINGFIKGAEHVQEQESCTTSVRLKAAAKLESESLWLLAL